MKYKVGDKVKVRDDLMVGNRYSGFGYVDDMSRFSGKIVTIRTVFEDENCYNLNEDIWRYRWTDEMFEEEASTEAEIAKFRAFLEEVANLDNDDYNSEYATLVRIVDYGQDGYDGYNYKECVDELCNFYRMFTPKKETKKKMTKAEIEDALGYKIEIVEE